MITLTLLHPVQSTPVQSWTFEHDSVVRIGRAVDNHVVLYSAVVSRYHVEIRLTNHQWEVVNLGTNGTYLDGKRVNQAPLTHGNIVRLARSGPNIQIYLDDISSAINGGVPQVESTQDVPALDERSFDSPVLVQDSASEKFERAELKLAGVSDEDGAPFSVRGRYSLFNQDGSEVNALPSHPCDHAGSAKDALICTDCGFPINPLGVVGSFQILKSLSLAGSTFMAWREGHTVILKTLGSEDQQDANLVKQFKDQARLLCELEHPGMPKVFEAFEAQGQPYLVSEMIYGSTLKDWVAQRGPVTQYQAVQWSLELSRLLDYLHQQTPPYFHSAIHPSNITRPRVAHGFSQVVLTNFGDVQGLMPKSGQLADSVGYTAPEQETGDGSSMSDLYALGATLLYLLTGQDPDAFYRLGDEAFCLQVQDVPNLSPEMADVIQRLTHPHLDQRFESAAAAIESLQLLL